MRRRLPGSRRKKTFQSLVRYWDYTIDSEALGHEWLHSPIFLDEWFGSIPLPDEAGASAGASAGGALGTATHGAAASAGGVGYNASATDESPAAGDAGDADDGASFSPDGHALARGRWAYTSVMNARGDDEYSKITNPYGLLRSPWNTAKTPYVMRSRYVMGMRDAGFSVPGCKDFAAAFESEWCVAVDTVCVSVDVAACVAVRDRA